MSERTLSDAPIPPAKLAHLVIRTAKFDDAKAWYQTVLGARIVFEAPFIAFLTYDDEHHRVALLNTPTAAAAVPGSAGVDHVAFTFVDIGALLSTYRRLERAGILPYWCINHGPTTSLYYRDPDGLQVELQIDNFEHQDDLRRWAATGAFARNPIGVEFDPDELCRRYLAGELEHSLRVGAIDS